MDVKTGQIHGCNACAELDKLKKEKENLNKNYTNLKLNNQALINEVKKFKRKNEEAEENLKDALYSNNILNDQIKKMMTEKKNLETNLKNSMITNQNLNNEIKKVRTEKEDLENNLSKVVNNNNVLNNEIKKVRTEKEDLENNLSKVVNNNNVLNNEIKKVRTEKEDLENNLKNVLNNNNVLNNEIKKVRTEKEDLENNLSKVVNNNNVLNNEIKLLKSKVKDLEIEHNKNTQLDITKIKVDMSKFYDIIIDIKSITDLAKPEGWPIKWNSESIKKNIDTLELVKIGVLGNGNVGKSFLLSRLLKIDIPSGYSIITEGLSLKFNEANKYSILDSAGLQTPLLRESIEKESIKEEKEDVESETKDYENLYRDKTQTENFIQNLIISLSDMLLIVVGKLTFNDQRLINKIKKATEVFDKTKQIYIIHNLLNFQTIEQVENHINEVLLNSASFNLKILPRASAGNTIIIKRNNNLYAEKIEKANIYHIIMAREGTEAGEYYNEAAYEYLREQFNIFTGRKPLPILDEIRKKFVEWSTDLLEEKIEMDNIIIDSNQNKFLYKDPNNKKLVPKACISDELGLIIYRSSGYEPPYYFYEEIGEERNKLVLVLEIPGEVEVEDIYADLDTNKIILKGDKKKPENFRPLQNNSIKYGKFVTYIPYGENIKLCDEDPIKEETEHKDGTHVYKFGLSRKRKDKINK